MSESYIAEVEVVHPDLPLVTTIQETAGTTVELESQPLTDVDAPDLFYSVRAPDFEAFERALADDHTVADWDVTIEAEGGRVYRISHGAATKFTTDTALSLGVRVITIESTERGWLFRLVAPDKADLGEFWRYCREEDVSFDLKRLYSAVGAAGVSRDREFEAGLTERQREVASTVARMGYYERDGANADAVATELDISPSTLSTHLRRINAALYRELF